MVAFDTLERHLTDDHGFTFHDFDVGSYLSFAYTVKSSDIPETTYWPPIMFRYVTTYKTTLLGPN